MFIVQEIATYGDDVRIDNIEVDENLDVNSILDLFALNWGMRIENETARLKWNKLVDEKWSELDNAEYYRYNKPLLLDDNWYTYDECGNLVSIEDFAKDLKDTLNIYEKFKKINNK